MATILAPTLDVLRFAAYHLDAGAHRLFIYQDDSESNAYASLKAHPKIRVHQCNDAHWKKMGGRRPVKNQVRQSQNATHAYNRKTDVDWLIHIDVDEFIVSQADIGTTLYKLDEQALCARLRPMEQLVGDSQTFKGFIPNGPSRNAIVTGIYPELEKYIKGRFLSHVAGKIFLRTGLEGAKIRIHNVFQREVTSPQQVKLPTMDLAHCHTKPWKDWLELFRYRLNHGSYRAELSAAKKDGFSFNALLTSLEASDGETGLKRFYDEVAVGTPAFQGRLKGHSLLRKINLNLDAKLARHVPDFT